MKFILLNHLKIQAKERDISIGLIEDALSNPEQIVPDLKGLMAAHKKYFDTENKKEYLIRVIFREEHAVRIGITVYKTSKIKKYWRLE